MVSGNDEHHEEKHGPGSSESMMRSVDSARVAWAGLSEEVKSKWSPAMIAGGHEARRPGVWSPAGAWNPHLLVTLVEALDFFELLSLPSDLEVV